MKGTTDPVAEGDEESLASRAAQSTKKKRMSSASRSEEVQFADDMWSELVHKGHIAGDERWVLGEDEAGRITIVRF